MEKYLEKTGDIRFEKIFHQRIGFLLLKDFAENVSEVFFTEPLNFSIRRRRLVIEN